MWAGGKAVRAPTLTLQVPGHLRVPGQTVPLPPSVVSNWLLETKGVFSFTHEWRAYGEASLTDRWEPHFPKRFLSHAPHRKPSTEKSISRSLSQRLPSVSHDGGSNQQTGPEQPEGESCSLKAFKCCYIFKTTYWRGELFPTPPSPEAQPLRLPGNLSRKHVANSNHAMETSRSVL